MQLSHSNIYIEYRWTFLYSSPLGDTHNQYSAFSPSFVCCASFYWSYLFPCVMFYFRMSLWYTDVTFLATFIPDISKQNEDVCRMLSSAAPEERVGCRARSPGGINTHSHIRFCSDPENSEMTFLNFILFSHLHWSLSTWLQQSSGEVFMICTVDWRLTLTLTLTQPFI